MGEFGGLFGDGGSAFLVQCEPSASGDNYFLLEDFFFGCASQLQEAIQISAEPGDRLRVVFDGGALSRAATARLELCIREIEKRSGIARSEVGAFATHQPNPRLVGLLARKSGIPIERFPMIADMQGNLGSTTCAAALHSAVQRLSSMALRNRLPIFLASLGPGSPASMRRR